MKDRRGDQEVYLSSKPLSFTLRPVADSWGSYAIQQLENEVLAAALGGHSDPGVTINVENLQ